MKHETKTIELPSGSKIEYKDYVNAGLYLDLQNIPEELAGTRLRIVSKGLITSFDGDQTIQGISQKVEEMTVKDLGTLSEALLKVVQDASSEEEEAKKKTDRPLSELDGGKEEHDGRDASSGDTD